MIEELKRKFGEPRIINCLSSDNREEFLITEDEQTKKSFIVPENTSADSDKCLVIKNPDNKTINHLSVDHCFLSKDFGYDGKKCDFVAFDTEKFCFVELKTNAESRKKVRENLTKARIQLGATIDYFDDNEIDFSSHVLEAYIILKNRLYPSDQASIKARRKKFFDEYDVDLLEKSEVIF